MSEFLEMGCTNKTYYYFAGVLISFSMMGQRSKERGTPRKRESATFILKRFDPHKLLHVWFLLWVDVLYVETLILVASLCVF